MSSKTQAKIVDAPGDHAPAFESVKRLSFFELEEPPRLVPIHDDRIHRRRFLKSMDEPTDGGLSRA